MTERSGPTRTIIFWFEKNKKIHSFYRFPAGRVRPNALFRANSTINFLPFGSVMPCSAVLASAARATLIKSIHPDRP